MADKASDRHTILIVDDNVIIQNMIKKVLESEYNVLLAAHAIDALAIIYHQPISLLLLDVSMPGIDGFELCKTVRNLPNFKNLPIVMLTARNQMIDKVQGRLAGATDYLTKPFDADKLHEVVGNLVQQQQA